ncbi:T-cell surface glycoprotein CD5 [Arapaima gigas]
MGNLQSAMQTTLRKFCAVSSLPFSEILSQVITMKVAVTIIALFLTDAVASLLNSTSSPSTVCPIPTPCPSCAPPVTCPPHLTTSPALPHLYTIHVTPGPSHCLGKVYLQPKSKNILVPICYNRNFQISHNLCHQLRCGEFQSWLKLKEFSNGYEIKVEKQMNWTTCNTLMIQCKALPASAELVAYKTMTWLLSILFIILILIRFGPGRCASINKKIFERKNREWIGPTQSQSVSFYRAQAGAQPKGNANKRSSYPALERLAVYPSREPSSNRNSCDSYN